MSDRTAAGAVKVAGTPMGVGARASGVAVVAVCAGCKQRVWIDRADEELAAQVGVECLLCFITAELAGVVVIVSARPVAGTGTAAPAVAETEGLVEAISWVQCVRCGGLVATSTDLLPYVELSSVVCHDCATSE
jgi:hypothetical protein